MLYSRKVERLLESRKPSLSILLEEMSKDDKKDLKKKEPEKSRSSAKGPEKASKSSSSSKPDEKENKKDDFDFDSFDFGEENKDDKEEKSETDDEQKPDVPKEDEDTDAKEKAIEDKIESKFKKVLDAHSPFNLSDEIDDKLFGSLTGENFFRKVGVASSFRLQEKKIFMTNKKILKEFSINDKVGDIDLSIDVLVSNAINLTKNFDNLIDIPDLILSHVSAKFAEKAIEDDDDNAGSEYRVKLEEFIEKYMQKLKTIDDYKNYDTSKYVISHNPQRPVATGARPST